MAVRENLAGPPLAPGGAGAGVDVGAHLAHFDAGSNTLSTPFQCSQCHGTTAPSDLTHVTGTVATGWGAVATAGGTTPTPATFTVGWEASPTCTNYCHGATLGAGSYVGSNRTPSWTATLTGCTTCHSSPGAGTHQIGNHVNRACFECHNSVMSSSSNTTIANPALHVNGTRDVQLNPARNMTLTKSGSTYTCSNGCHGSNSESSSSW